mgnify:CR=1 FL=1
MALNSKNKNHGFKEALKKSGLSVISEVKKSVSIQRCDRRRFSPNGDSHCL